MSHNHIKNNVIRFPVERIKGRRPLPEEFPEPASEDDDYPENEWFEREDELWAIITYLRSFAFELPAD